MQIHFTNWIHQRNCRGITRGWRRWIERPFSYLCHYLIRKYDIPSRQIKSLNLYNVNYLGYVYEKYRGQVRKTNTYIQYWRYLATALILTWYNHIFIVYLEKWNAINLMFICIYPIISSDNWLPHIAWNGNTNSVCVQIIKQYHI
jgi:hypothetical protein